eukprot:1153535-Pelagomonas_calceolata.AAC.5
MDTSDHALSNKNLGVQIGLRGVPVTQYMTTSQCYARMGVCLMDLLTKMQHINPSFQCADGCRI